jgi:sugar/nucleoside kinase (ribokinase family)
MCAGRETETQEQVEAAARQMQERGVQTVLVKRGTKGSLLLSRGGQCISQPIFPVQPVRSVLLLSAAACH